MSGNSPVQFSSSGHVQTTCAAAATRPHADSTKTKSNKQVMSQPLDCVIATQTRALQITQLLQYQ